MSYGKLGIYQNVLYIYLWLQSKYLRCCHIYKFFPLGPEGQTQTTHTQTFQLIDSNGYTCWLYLREQVVFQVLQFEAEHSWASQMDGVSGRLMKELVIVHVNNVILQD